MLLITLACSILGSDVELMETAKGLALAAKERDVDGLAGGFERCGRENGLDGLKVLLTHYGAVEDLPEDDLSLEDRFRLYSVCARAIARIDDREALAALPSLALREKRWGARAILVAGARLNPNVDAVALSVSVLARETHPVVLREAIKTLGVSKRKDAIPVLIDFWDRIAAKMGPSKATARPRKGKGGGRLSYRSPEWERVPLALQEALTRLCGRVLAAPEQYRRLYEHHGKEIDPTQPVELGETGRTVIFGLELVGKNIAFVLDVSGSMETTDPLPEGQYAGPRTRVKGENAFLVDENRMRIHRAKEELKRVIAGLPEDKSFNVIAFSSDVKPWRDHLVAAGKGAKAGATDFVDGLRAEGITVTDVALEFAFEDPIVDTIYLITDGAPTHRGSYGPGLPEDAPRLIEQILKRARVLNFRRGVRIYTLGFPGAEEDFLKRLSEEHGGTYRPIK